MSGGLKQGSIERVRLEKPFKNVLCSGAGEVAQW